MTNRQTKADRLHSSERPALYGQVFFLPESDFVRFLTVKQGLKPSSIRHIRLRFLVFLDFLNKASTTPTPDSAEQFIFELRSRGLKNNSINTYVFTLRQLDEYARDRGLAWAGFSQKINSFEKNRPLIEVLSVEEIENILNVDMSYRFHGMDLTEKINTIYKTMIRFLATTGCRFDEAASLLVKNLDLPNARVSFVNTKNQVPRFGYLAEPLLSELKKIVSNKLQDNLVFTGSTGNKVIVGTFLEDLKKRAKLAGVTKRVHPHLFRHSFATQLLVSGVEITRVASILGHKDIQTTFQNYVHLADDIIRQATYHHPLIRKNINPKEIIKIIRDTIQSYQLSQDFRFDYAITETDSGLEIKIKTRDTV